MVNGKPYAPKYIGLLGVLKDCDSSAVAIGLKIAGGTRLGVDINTIAEIKKID